MTVTEHGHIVLSASLREATRDAHAALDARIGAADPFIDRMRYGRYLSVQAQFFAHVDGLYGDPSLKRLIPDLATRSRLAAVERDCADLGMPAPAAEPVDATGAAALGWLYVAEGSRLGGAHLLREAAALGFGPAFGARHLAPPAEGLGLSWNAFRRALDAADADGDEAVKAAFAAFAYVARAVETAFRGVAG